MMLKLMMKIMFWVATNNGVSVFDGYSWTIYGGSNGIQGTVTGTVNDISKSPDGTVWFATSAGLISYDGESWQQHQHENYDNCSRVFTPTTGNIWVIFQVKDYGELEYDNHMYYYDGLNWSEKK